MAGKSARKTRPYNCSADDRQKCPQLDDAVAPGELGFWKEFGQQAVFRRSENSGLATGKKYRHKQQRYRGLGIRMKTQQREYGKNHDRNLENLCADRDRTLAEAVREIAAGHGKQNEWRGKERADQKDEMVFLFGIKMKRKNQVDEKILEAILIERALKLRDDQTPEAKAPAACPFGHVCVSV